MFNFCKVEIKSIKCSCIFYIALFFVISTFFISCGEDVVISYEDIGGNAYAEGTCNQIELAVKDIFYDGYEDELKTAANNYFDETNENIESYINWYFGFFHGVEKRLSGLIEYFTDTDIFADREVNNVIKGINKKLLPKKSLTYTLGVPLFNRQKALNKKVNSILKKNELKLNDKKTYQSIKKITLAEIYVNAGKDYKIVPIANFNTKEMGPESFCKYVFDSDPSDDIVDLFLVQTLNFAAAIKNAKSEMDFNDMISDGLTEEALKFGAKKLVSAFTKVTGPMGFVFDLSADISFERGDHHDAFLAIINSTVENAREFYLNKI